MITGLVCQNSLEEVKLFQSYLPDIPSELFAEDANHLAAIHAHFHDLDAGERQLTDVKLIVLGNGGAGKTQLVRRLRGEDFQEKSDSTHGIWVTSAQLLEAADSDTTSCTSGILAAKTFITAHMHCSSARMQCSFCSGPRTPKTTTNMSRMAYGCAIIHSSTGWSMFAI